MRIMKRLVLSTALVGVLLFSSQPAAAAAIRDCGVLQALQRPNLPQQEGPGSVRIDGRTYVLTSAQPTVSSTNHIDPDVAVGKNVCLTGDILADGSGVNNFIIRVCAGSACTLPSTSTQQDGPPPAALLAFAIAVTVILVLRRSRREADGLRRGLR